MTSARRRLGWYAFDWAAQPYATLILTFVFAPYLRDLLADGAAAQAAWGYTTGLAGLAVALTAPVLGAVADRAGHRRAWIAAFSVLYVAGAAGLWGAAPGDPDIARTLACAAVGLVGMEFATIFTNAMLPGLGPRADLGRISGTGWALGYAGGVVALALVLALFAESPDGRTLLGRAPVLGLDPAAREGTRATGPITALWYAVFMIPFFAWVRDPPPAPPTSMAAAAGAALPRLARTLRRLPATPSRLAFLAASMLYRDALAGIYIFGGLYAAGVLGWSVVQTGVFGILAAVAGALFAWLGGRADSAFGPKPVITTCVAALTALAVGVVLVSPAAVLGVPVAPASPAPDIAFYLIGIGIGIGAAGGAVQAASRTMMVRQAAPGRMTESFGLYAFAGKATAFLAPLAVGGVTDATGSQPLGVLPVVALFAAGLVLLRWAQPQGEEALP